MLVLRSSKTDTRCQEPQIVKITGIEDKLDKHFADIPKYCPSKILLEYLDARGDLRNNNELFFIYRDGSPVKPDNFRAVLKECIKMTGLDETQYDTHSLHIGRAVDLFKMGIPIESNKKSGRWKSNSVYDYLKKC